MYTGIGASAGIGIGSVVIVKEPSLAYDNVAVSDIAAEKERFNNALEKCIAKTQAMAEDMKTRVGAKEAEILEGHVLLLMDPEMTGQINSNIENEKMCAEAAVEQVCDMYAQMFSSIEDEMFQQRATDVCDIKTRLLKILLDVEDIDLAVVPEGTVLVAEDLTPSMTAGINPANVAGVLTEIGGKTSHSAILARALEIPAVLSIEGIVGKVENGQTVVLTPHDLGRFPEDFVLSFDNLKKAADGNRLIIRYQKFRVSITPEQAAAFSIKSYLPMEITVSSWPTWLHKLFRRKPKETQTTQLDYKNNAYNRTGNHQSLDFQSRMNADLNRGYHEITLKFLDQVITVNAHLFFKHKSVVKEIRYYTRTDHPIRISADVVFRCCP